jgi:leucine dehydrogenase
VVAETEAHAVEPDRILEQRVDVLVPCALGGVLNDASIPKLACRLIAGAANNQLAEDRHADAIAARGIVYLPDFILNAGGVIGASQEGTELGGGAVAADYDEGRAFKETGKIADLVVAAIERAERESTTPYAAAVRMAKETIQQLRQSA